MTQCPKYQLDAQLMISCGFENHNIFWFCHRICHKIISQIIHIRKPIMNYQDKIFINLPTIWHSPWLKHLAIKLNTYQGLDELARLGGALEVEHSYPKPQASVLVLISHETTPKLMLTKRSHRLSHHAGEIAFVGGHRDDTDNNTAQTALREAFEEVRLPNQSVSVIGYLPMQQAKSGIWVRPVVGLVEPTLTKDLLCQEAEIERIFWVALDYFKQTPPSVYEFDHTLGNQTLNICTPAWFVEGETVWGLTGRIIANLMQIGFDVQIDWYYQQKPTKNF